ncbi:MAG: hypothetical protein DRN66_02340 [Candidatus Nanohalarchaeota archaeon]|nr:MAG: hypothetical protein DRN66_02340 [Candidatus Nanohaloarchaeota archaeon]
MPDIFKKKRTKDKRHNSTINLEKKLIEVGYKKKEQLDKKTFFDELLVFIDSIFRSLVEVERTKNIMIFMNAFFIDIIRSYPAIFEPLKKKVIASSMYDLPEEYITKTMSISVLSFFLVFAGEFAKLIITVEELTIKMLVFDMVIIPFFSVFALGIIFYFIPFVIANHRMHSIETNMPFGLNHMSAITSAGVPPEAAFMMLVEYGEYGEFSNEMKKIIKRMNTFGEDLNKSIIYVLKTTPSDKFKEFLYGMVSVIEGGGNISEYLDQIASVSMFDYRMRKKRYTASLSTFGDIYTVILIAAPFFIISLFTIMNMVPSAKIGGMDILTLMNVTTYIMIPGLNIIFIMFLYAFQPDI